MRGRDGISEQVLTGGGLHPPHVRSAYLIYLLAVTKPRSLPFIGKLLPSTKPWASRMKGEPRELSARYYRYGHRRGEGERGPTVCRLNVDASRGNLGEAWNLHDIPF